MRGDSIRDLYAKALALFGLSLLAGAGAIVDYWPVAGDVPRVIRAPHRLPLAAHAPLAAEVPLPTNVPAPAVRLASATTKAVASAASPATELFVSMPVSTALPVGQPVTLAIPVTPVLIPAPAVDAPAEQVELAELPTSWPRDRANLPMGSSILAATQPTDDGFFSGALKKTRDSILRTGAATGASIADMFRGVANAFKKVSPFNDEAFFRSSVQ